MSLTYLHACPTAQLLQEDERRVSQLFSEASAAGIPVQQRSLSSFELQEAMLTRACLVISLLAKRRLDPFPHPPMALPTLVCISRGPPGPKTRNIWFA